jgi:CheY-like chemotaxis protein
MVADAARLLEGLLPRHVTVRTAVAPSRKINADSVMLRHAVIELGRFVADDLPPGGLLCLSLDELHARRPVNLPGTLLPAGHYVVLTVAASNSRRKLGLTVCYPGSGLSTPQIEMARRIVADYGGAVVEYGEPGRGSAAVMYLPVWGEHMSLEEQPAPAAAAERILIVDDDPAVLKVLQRMLSRRGYQVVTAIGGAEALHVFSAERGWFDLVISDQTMPAITGIQLGIQLNSMQPGTAMLLCSGFRLELDDSLKAAAGIRAVIVKPINSRELESCVRQILDERAAAAAVMS